MLSSQTGGIHTDEIEGGARRYLLYGQRARELRWFFLSGATIISSEDRAPVPDWDHPEKYSHKFTGAQCFVGVIGKWTPQSLHPCYVCKLCGYVSAGNIDEVCPGSPVT